MQTFQVYYPVLVLQGQLLEARPSSGSVHLFARRHLALRRSEFVRGQEQTYEIDVVHEQHFGAFLSQVRKDTKQLVRRRKTTQTTRGRLCTATGPQADAGV